MPSTRLPARAVLPLGIAAALAAALVLLPLPGSLSVVGTRWLSSAGSSVPSVELISEAGLLLLAGATAVVMACAWWSRPGRRSRIALSAVGVLFAYLLSEGGKLLFAQARPCSVWQTAGECPQPGDWSLPSNHATLAFGAAAAIAVALGRSWLTWSALALASVVAVGRVAQGVHYVHDVALGAILGLAVPLLLIIGVEAMTHAVRARGAATQG
ncbi:MAG: phosphatase family protein [Microbacterium sp.]|jgi:undecaprenyl-diphosphatase|nr:phosphatase family protein [Microbacterium sp.]